MALDDADKKYIVDLLKGALSGEALSPIVGEAVKQHLGALKLDEKIASGVKEATKDFKPADKEDDGKDGKKRGEDGKFSKADDDTAKRFAALEKRVEDERKGREASEEARRRDQLDVSAREALAKAGVPVDRVRHAMAVLKQDGVFDLDKDGRPGWKGKDKFGVEGLLPLEEGAAAWAKSDDGKHFLPAKNAAGTGEGSQRGWGPQSSGPVKLADLANGGGSSIWNALQSAS